MTPGTGTDPEPRTGAQEPAGPSVAGVVLASVGIGTCLLLGTVGWFMVGFGTMTDCTNNYSCTDTGCAPCDPASRWITAGGVIQLSLALTGAIGLGLGLRLAWRARLAVGGTALIAASIAAMYATTSHAAQSYCQPGTPGYAASYCSTED